MSRIDDATKIVGILAGIIACAKGSLELFKQYRESQAAFVEVMQRPRARIFVALTVVGLFLAVGAATAWVLRPPPPSSVPGGGIERIPYPTSTASPLRKKMARKSTNRRVQIEVWNVVGARAYSIVANHVFHTRGQLSAGSTLQPVVRWLSSTLKSPHSSINVYLRIPSDLTRNKIGVATQPSVKLQVSYFRTDANSKQQRSLPYDTDAVLSPGLDYTLEFELPGYDPHLVTVRASHPDYEQRFVLQPQKLNVIVQAAANNDRPSTDVAAALSGLLAGAPAFMVVRDDTLDTLTKQINTGPSRYAPMEQTSVRSTYRVDYVILVHSYSEE